MVVLVDDRRVTACNHDRILNSHIQYSLSSRSIAPLRCDMYRDHYKDQAAALGSQSQEDTDAGRKDSPKRTLLHQTIYA